MSYLVLARKWRPQVFEDVIGQEHITTTLQKAIQQQRVAHAFIFSGTRGVGKTTTARILSRALNCDNGPTPNPCGTCATCKNILSGNSFDVLEIDGASNNRVEDIRELRENVNYSSMGGKYRIFVIDEVHMLTKQAFNALLKTLEEPPPNVIFIFATTEPHKIPDTIHSRCQRYDFRRITAEQILAQLEKICTAESITYERTGLLLVARKAEGSMRDALSLLDQVYSFCRESIVEKDVRSVLGLVDAEVYSLVMDSIINKQPEPALAAIQDALYHGFDLSDFCGGLEEYLRSLLFIHIPAIAEKRRVDLNIDSEQSLATVTRQSEQIDEGQLLRMIDLVRRTHNDLKRSTFGRFSVEVMIMKMCALDATVSLENLLGALGGGTPPSFTHAGPSFTSLQDQKKKNPELPSDSIKPEPLLLKESVQTIEPPNDDSPPIAECIDIPQPQPTVYSKPEPIVPLAQEIADPILRWPDFLEHLLHERPNIGSFLALSKVKTSDTDSIDILFRYAYRFQYSEITKRENKETVNEYVTAFMRRPIELRIHLEPASAHPSAEIEPDLPQRKSIDDEIAQEPIIASVLELFDGEIL